MSSGRRRTWKGGELFLKYREKAVEDTIQVTEVCFEKEGGGRDIAMLSGAFRLGISERRKRRRSHEHGEEFFWRRHTPIVRLFWRNPEGCDMSKKRVDSVKKAFICVQRS